MVSISVATFVPKPFTPFEFEPQITKEEMHRKQMYIKDCITSKKISFSWHDSATSFLEGAFARGDRRLGAVIESAYKKGCKFDGWSEMFNLDAWLEAFKEQNIDPAFFANRKREYDETFAFDHLNYFVDKAFLIKENKLAHSETTTKNCREQCSNCGAKCLGEGVCFEKR